MFHKLKLPSSIFNPQEETQASLILSPIGFTGNGHVSAHCLHASRLMDHSVQGGIHSSTHTAIWIMMNSGNVCTTQQYHINSTLYK